MSLSTLRSSRPDQYQVFVWTSLDRPFPEKFSHYLQRAFTKPQSFLKVSYIIIRRNNCKRLSVDLSCLRRSLQFNHESNQIHILIHYFFVCNPFFPMSITFGQSVKISCGSADMKSAIFDDVIGLNMHTRVHFVDIAVPLSHSLGYPKGDPEMFEKGDPMSLNSYGYECLAAELAHHISAKVPRLLAQQLPPVSN